MSNYHPENGGIDPRFIKINPVGGLHDPILPEQSGIPQAEEMSQLITDNSSESFIMNGTMTDMQGEMPKPVQPEIVQYQDIDLQSLARVETDLAAIEDPGPDSGLKHSQKESHRLFLESVYSRQFTPVLRSLLDATSNDAQQNAEVRGAIQSANSALQEVRTYGETEEKNLYQSFLDVDGLSDTGHNQFRFQMKTAETAAIECIRKHKGLLTDPQTAQAANEILGRYIEREQGVEIPDGFMERIADPNTRVLMLQLDFNSTLNAKESSANVGVNKQAQNTIRNTVEAFKKYFPNKKIFVNLNTGRPDQYIWGVHEAMMAGIPEASQFALAESGGVILTNMESGATEVAVDQPEQWKRELHGIRDYITAQLANPEDLMIERKQSMLSIRLAQPHGETFILKTKDGQPVDNEWIKAQMKHYFLDSQNALGNEELAIAEDLVNNYPQAKEFIEQNLNGNADRTQRDGVLQTLEEVYSIATAEHKKRFKEIDERLDMINQMYRPLSEDGNEHDGKLQAKYNPTAGYTDIAHVDLNKYSSSVRYVCKQLGVTPDQIAWAIVGDSSTDIIPETKTGKGEPNEDADKAYMFAVREHNSKMHAALERRGDKGKKLENDSTLAVIAVMKGLERKMKSLFKKNTPTS